MFDINNKIGEIHFSENVIKSILLDAVESAGEKVHLYNYRGRYKTAVKGLSNIVIEQNEDEEVEITIYVIVKFGTSISTVTNKILDKVYENMETMLNITPKSVRVVVTGVESKDIARRNLEFIR